MAIEKFRLVMHSAKMIAPKVRHISFVREDQKSLDYIPGQFITFMLPVDEGKIKRRSYSIASVIGKDDTIDIAVSYVEGGVASEQLFNLKKGDTLDAMGPAGRLTLSDNPVKRYILVGTGTGIAPYRSMLPSLAKVMSEHDTEVVILLGAQYRQDCLYKEDFLAFAEQHKKATFVTCLSREDLDPPEDFEHTGYVQSYFDELALNPSTDVVYLCGNPNMIDSSYETLVELEFDNKSVRREKYISSN